MDKYLDTDTETIQTEVVRKIEFNLARTRFSMNNNVWYQAVAYTVRDRLIEFANDTRKCFLAANKKRVYYFSLEYLPGRALKNALINLDLEDNYKKALEGLGQDLEKLYEQEQDPGIGNGGLGRLASCFLDSCASHEYPVWGYGIRYNYGIFKQKIINNAQCEVPDYWLMEGYPWEIRRSDIKHRIRFYGKVRKEVVNGKERAIWEDGDLCDALAFDTLVPGFDTFNTLTLRLWSSKPAKEFDFSVFNEGDYFKAVKDKQRAEFISSVLYPNDANLHGKELRLAQQYFFVSASLQDLLWRFRVMNKDWEDLPNKVNIQLNDTHPAIGIIELLRLLVDEEELELDYAWSIVKKVFAYTNHTVMTEALEKWSEDLMGKLIPRHLELIHLVNLKFLEEVEKRFPGDGEKRREMSIVEEGETKMIRMPQLSIIGSHTVNGVAKIHSDLLKSTLFKHFHEMWPEKFQNKTNGVTHRRWIACANPGLAEIYTKSLGTKEWLKNMELIKGLLDKLEDEEFRYYWNEVKQKNKKRLAEWVKEATGVVLREDSMFDIMVKRIHEYKRQLLNAFYVIWRYLKLKEMPPEERKKMVPRSVMLGGKAAPGYVVAKQIIKLINIVGEKINKDQETNGYLKLVFLPNYGVSNAEVIIPAADVCQQVSLAGTEASGTGNMKFIMNGALILGTFDGANVEIAEEIGEENIITFGLEVDGVEKVKAQLEKGELKEESMKEAKKVIEAIESGMFGDDKDLKELMETVKGKKDRFLVKYELKSYIEAQEKMDEWYKDREKWTKKSIINALKSSKFSSDRTIHEYVKDIWGIESRKILSPEEEGKETRVCCKLNRKPSLGKIHRE